MKQVVRGLVGYATGFVVGTIIDVLFASLIIKCDCENSRQGDQGNKKYYDFNSMLECVNSVNISSFILLFLALGQLLAFSIVFVIGSKHFGDLPLYLTGLAFGQNLTRFVYLNKLFKTVYSFILF